MRVMLRIIAVLLALTALSGGATEAQDAERAQLLRSAGESRAKGADGATVLVYEIADFQCPYCARFAVDVFPKIDSAYVRTGKVRWVFVNLPMPSHVNAWAASEAALCAGAVANRFWPVHDRLFAGIQEWSAVPDPGVIFARYAREAGVPADAFNACVANDRVAPVILQDVIFGSRVSGTPTFIVNNEKTVVGMKSWEEWREIIEEALKARR